MNEWLVFTVNYWWFYIFWLAILCPGDILHDEIIDCWRYIAWRDYWLAIYCLAIFCWRYFAGDILLAIFFPYTNINASVQCQFTDIYIGIHCFKWESDLQLQCEKTGYWTCSSSFAQPLIEAQRPEAMNAKVYNANE